MDLLGYSDEFFQKALSRNIRVLTRGKSSVKKSLAILLGGQSGSGKTTIHRIKIEEYQGNLIVIDGDSFRYQHPNYNQLQEIYGKESVNYTRDFAGKMVEALIEQLSDRGYQLLIEGTLRTVEVPQKTATLLKTKNYTIELAVMATKPELSYLSTLIRYKDYMSKIQIVLVQLQKIIMTLLLTILLRIYKIFKKKKSLIKFRFIKEIGDVVMIHQKIANQQQRYFMLCFSESGLWLKKKC